MEDLPGVILLFFLTALISAYGSLQLGPVNGAVLRYCFRGEFRAAIWLALGGSLTEIPYAACAIWGSSLLSRMKGLESWISLAIIPLFLILGIRFLLAAGKNPDFGEGLESKPKRNPLLEGLGLALFNPQLPLFWISILIWMKSSLGLYPESLAAQISFVLATAAGAFFLLWLLVRFSIRKRHHLRGLSRRYHPEKLIGWFFIGMALLQGIRFCWF